MRKRLGRELWWMIAPVLLLGGVAWWKTRDDNSPYFTPPEILTVGQPRVVVGKWRELQPTPFDVYRGQFPIFEVPLWVAGAIPDLKPSGRPTVTKSYRQVLSNYPVPQLYFQQNGKWHKLENGAGHDAVNIDRADVAPGLRDRLVAQLHLSLGQLPKKHGRVILHGKFGARVEDRETRLVNKIPTDEPIHDLELQSQDIKRQVLGENQKPPVPVVDRTVPFELSDCSVWSNGQTDVTLHFSWTTAAGESGDPSSVALDNGRFFDADGKLIGRVESYSWSGGSSSADFEITCRLAQPQVGAKRKRPLVFQGAVSANNCWPLQVNIELPLANQSVNPRNSSLAFKR